MQQINMTVQSVDTRLQLIRGKPDPVDMDKLTAHMLFSYPDLEVEVWILGNLMEAQKQQVTQSLLLCLEQIVETQPSSALAQAAPDAKKDGKQRILIVDDEEFTLEVFQMFLELSGYQVITTVNSEQAVRMAELEHPDCVLLDVMMPGLDGFSLCKLIRATPSIQNIPVIFCTAYAALDVEDRRKASGGDKVILKPMEMTSLVQAIETTLEQHKAVDPIQEGKKLRPTIKKTMTIVADHKRVSLESNTPPEGYVAAFHHLITGE